MQLNSSTGTDPNLILPGLFINDTFSVTALFDLIMPEMGEAYAIRLYDYSPTQNGPVGVFVTLLVRCGINSPEPTIQFRRGDYSLDDGITYINNTIIEEIAVNSENGYDQIGLTLERSDTTNNSITASFIYYLGGQATGAPYVFSNTSNIFSSASWTQVEFRATKSTPISTPEPTTMLLLGLGLMGLAGVRRKFKK